MTNPIPSPAAGSEEQIKAIVNNALTRLRTADGKGIMHMTTAEFVLREDIAALLAIQNDATYAAVMEAIGGNEPEPFGDQYTDTAYVKGKNNLRAQLRQTIAKIFGKEQV